ncbi:MAG: hypothetical protein Q4D64_07790 [Prevotellaceae bacterium]|nr:hypothetical protein [Prevotellaceae bacterium]
MIDSKKLCIRSLSSDDRDSVSLWQSPVILLTETTEILINPLT